MFFIHLLLLGLIGAVLTQSSQFDDFSNAITLPPELEKRLNGSDTEKLKNKYLDVFKKKCEENGHPDLYESAKNSTNVFLTCLQTLVDLKLLESEIEEAKPEGRVDEVFKKYCAKKPQFLQCLQRMTDSIKPCFNANEQKNFKTLHNITGQLGEFICFKDGERIALFIAEGGRECYQNNQEKVQECFQNTFDQKSENELKETAFSILDSPVMDFKIEQCEQVKSLEKCIVVALDKCESAATSNIVESLFKFLMKSTPCEKLLAKAKPSSSARTITSAVMVTALSSLLIF